MVSRVTYRPFDGDDFNELASILQEAWCTNAPSPGFGFLQACADLAHCLSISTFSQVALIDGAPRGIALARANSMRIPLVGRWQRASEDYLKQMEILAPRACATYLDSVNLTNRTNERLLAKSGLADANEITLLAVNSSARGMGIGSVLLDAVSSYLTSNGAQRAFLYTDSNCSWPFYEQHGFKRAASTRPKREERKLLPKELYLYELDLSTQL